MPIPYDKYGNYWVIEPYIYTSPYFVLAAVAAIVGVVMIHYEFRRRRQQDAAKHTLLCSLTVYLFLIASARLLYLLGPWSWEDYPTIASRILGIFSLKPGMVFYGGLVGGILGLFAYTRFRKLDFWKFADTFAPSGGIILFFGRIGCFTSGCCYGLASRFNLPWLLQWKDELMHPTQLYSSMLGLALFVVMTELKYRQSEKKLFDGYVILWGVLLYSIGRFLIEFLRHYDNRFFGLSVSQFISMALFCICAILLIRSYGNARKRP